MVSLGTIPHADGERDGYPIDPVDAQPGVSACAKTSAR